MYEFASIAGELLHGLRNVAPERKTCSAPVAAQNPSTQASIVSTQG